MRATTLLALVLGVKHTRVRDVTATVDGVVADVALTTRLPRCSGCGCRARRVYDRRTRSWRHLDLAGVRLTLRAIIRRVRCARCGVRTELVPWAPHGVWFTYAFADAVAYLARYIDFATVATLARTTRRSVAALVGRVLTRPLGGDGLDDLTVIGIDEIAYRPGHRYLTVVVDHLRRRVVWAAPGHDKATVRRFFVALGPQRIAKLRAVTLDLSGAYREAVQEAAPRVTLVFDRFHVARLAHRALDAVRLSQMRAHTDPAAARELKRKEVRRALQQRSAELSAEASARLDRLARNHRMLWRAYLLKEDLADVFDSADVRTARRRFDRWRQRAARSRLAPFQKLARTLAALREGLIAYVELGLTNALAEGFNLKIRTLIYRGFGVPDADNLIARILLCCGGIELRPPHVTPRFH